MASQQRIVYVDFQFNKIGEIDNMNDKYYADVSFQLHWTENAVIESYNKDEHWNPKVVIENLYSKPEESVSYELSCNGSSTEVIEKRYIKGFFWERLEIHNFPHDVQELSVLLASKLVQPNVVLKARNCTFTMNIRTYVDQQKWKLLNLVEPKEQYSDKPFKEGQMALIDTSKMAFVGYACRHPSYYYINAYFLIFLVTVVSLGMFSIDFKLPQNRLQTTATILLTSVSFKWAINRSLPPVSYTTSLDQYSIVSIFYLCVNCAYHSIIGAFSKSRDAGVVDKWMTLVFAVIFIFIQVFFCVKAYISHSLVVILKKKEKKMV